MELDRNFGQEELKKHGIKILPSKEFFNFQDAFPNPASNQVYVAVEQEIILKEIAIMDITGRLIKTYFANSVKEYDGLYLIDIYGLEDGVYQVLLTIENEKTLNYKLIVKN